MDIDKHINTLEAEIKSSEDPGELFVYLENQIALLRKSYKSEQSRFSALHVDKLRGINELAQNIGDYLFYRDELDRANTYEYCKEIETEINDIIKVLNITGFIGKIKTLQRQYREKASEYRSQGGFNGKAELDSKVSSIQQHSPGCRKCGSKMVLRASEWGYFWGCSRFPDCFGKRYLSADDNQKLATETH